MVNLIQMQKTFQTINIPKLPVFTTEEGIKQIENNLSQISDWKNISELIPQSYFNKKMYDMVHKYRRYFGLR